MLPRITQLELDTQELPDTPEPIGKEFLFDFKKSEFVTRNGSLVPVYGIDSLKVWIEKTLRTEQFRFAIYEGTEYGVQLENLIGSNYPREFIEAEIKREVTEALTQHPHINAIENWRFERDGKLMRIWFTVITPETTFDQEVMI